MSSFGFAKVFLGKIENSAGSEYLEEYLEGTAVARLWFEVIVGYYRGKKVVMFD
jgi:hypothetical protein